MLFRSLDDKHNDDHRHHKHDDDHNNLDHNNDGGTMHRRLHFRVYIGNGMGRAVNRLFRWVWLWQLLHSRQPDTLWQRKRNHIGHWHV